MLTEAVVRARCQSRTPRGDGTQPGPRTKRVADVYRNHETLIAVVRRIELGWHRASARLVARGVSLLNRRVLSGGVRGRREEERYEM